MNSRFPLKVRKGGGVDEMDVPSCHALFCLWRNTEVLSKTVNGSSSKAGNFTFGLFLPLNPT